MLFATLSHEKSVDTNKTFYQQESKIFNSNRLIVDSHLLRLRLLILPVGVPDQAATLEDGASLMKVKRHAVFDELNLGFDDPVVVVDSSSGAGFPTAGDAFDGIVVLYQV